MLREESTTVPQGMRNTLRPKEYGVACMEVNHGEHRLN